MTALLLSTTQATAGGLPVDAVSGPVVGDVADVSGIGDVSVDSAALSETERFVRLWDARFSSGPAFQAYLDSDAEYDDGYNDAPPEEQARLVRALVDRWRATDQAFAASVDWDREPVTGEAQGDRPTGSQLRALVESIVFHKKEFKAALRAKPEGADSGTPAPPSSMGPTPIDPLAEAAVVALDAATKSVAVTPALGVIDALGTAPDRLPERLVDAVPNAVFDRLPTAGDIAGADLGELGATLGGLLDEASRTVRTVAEPVGATAYAPSLFGPQNLTYTVCWQLPSAGETCSATPYVVGIVAAVPGQSALVDVDGNVTTGLAGKDLEISLTVDPLTTPGGLAATVEVKRHGTAAANARGVIRYRLPDSDKEARVGFDGRGTTLQAQQRATVLFESLVGLSTGDTRIRSTVSHSGPAGAVSVALETSYLGGATPSSLAALTTFGQAPSAFTVRYTQQRTGQSDVVRVETSHNGPVLPEVTADVMGTLAQSRVVARARLDNVPSSSSVMLVADDATDSTQVVYGASSSLSLLDVYVAAIPDLTNAGTFYVAGLQIANLPSTMSATVARDHMTYSANATGGGLVASLDQYTSSQLARRGFVRMTSTPAAVTVTTTTASQRYVLDSGSTGIAEIEVAYLDNPLHLEVGVRVTGFPGHAELTMPAGSDPRVAWTASAPTTAVNASGRFGAWAAELNVTNVPASMSIVPGTANLDVSATGGTGTTIDAWLSNYGSYSPSPHAGDNYATATRVKVPIPTPSGSGATVTFVSAAVRIQNLVRVRVVPGATTTVQLQAGGGSPLYVKYSNEDRQTRRRAFAEARLVNFPGLVNASFGPTTQITTNANADLTATFDVGPIVTGLASLPTAHGVVVRRTAHNGVPLVRGRVHLTGLPTSVTIAPGTVQLAGLRPSVPTLTVDVQLLDDPVNPVTAYANLNGIPIGTPHTITLTWGTAPHLTGYRTSVKATTSGATFGSLLVVVGYGRYGASVETSALPSSMEATITEVEGSTSFAWQASASLTTLRATGAARPSPGVTYTARATVELTDLPPSFTLTTGRDGSGAGPLLTYNASATPRLDALVVADGSLKTSNTSVDANLLFRLRDLAPSLTVAKAGAGFQLTGSSRTTLVEVRVSASANYSTSGGSESGPTSWLKFKWGYELGASAVLDDLNVSLSDVRSFTVRPGIASELSGDYGWFTLRWDSFTVDLRARASLDALFRVKGNWYGFEIIDIQIATQWSINPTIRLYEPGFHDVLNERVLVLWCVGARLQPKALPHNTTMTAGINLGGAPGTTRRNWATPVAFGWNLLSDVVTGAVVYPGAFAQGWLGWC